MLLWPARQNYAPHLAAAEVHEDLAYAGAHPKQALDLVVPRAGSGPAPLVVFLHGGGFKALDRKLLRGWLGLHTNVGLALARRGIAAAIVGYRQHPVADGDASLADLRAAIAWLTEHGPEHRIDPRRLVLVGHSAGAHLALVLATAGAQVRGAALVAGFYDLPRVVVHLGRRDQAVMRTVFGASEADAERWSPERRISPQTPPLLAAVPEREAAWLRAEHDALVAAAGRAGARLRAHVLPRVGHMGAVIQMGTRDDPTTDLLADFVHDVCA